MQPSLVTRSPVLATMSSWTPLAGQLRQGEDGLAHADWRDRGGCQSHPSSGFPQAPEISLARSALDQPNIVKLFKVIDTRESPFLVMEHLRGGDTLPYLEDRGRATADEARGTSRPLVSAVQ